MSATIIQQLNSSNSKKHKEAVLSETLLMAEQMGSIVADRFLRLYNRCYDSFQTFGIKRVPETTGIANAECPWSEFDQLLDKLSARTLTGNAAIEAVDAMSLRFDSDEWNLLLRPVILRDLRVGCSEKTFNKVCKNTKYEIPVFSCQLATDSNNQPSKLVGRHRLEVKLDGMRVIAVVTRKDGQTSVTLHSRNGKLLENFPHIEEQIRALSGELPAFLSGFTTVPSSFILDGEVMSTSFQELMRHAHRKGNAKTGDAVFNIFDCMPLDDFRRGYFNAQQHKRLRVLNDVAAKIKDRGFTALSFMTGIDVDLSDPAGHRTMREYADDAVAAGFEGIMIKSLDSPYECRRSTHWLKWKPVEDFDLQVVDVEPGTGKNEGKLGALVCTGVDNGRHIRVNVGSGFTDEQRQEFWDNQSEVIGQTAVVLADAITQNQDGGYSLRFPRFKTFREDK